MKRPLVKVNIKDGTRQKPCRRAEIKINLQASSVLLFQSSEKEKTLNLNYFLANIGSVFFMLVR